MYKTFKENLPKAQGRSEFVIAVNADIRGFSAFSRINESPNIAIFIKRFYLQMINSYFTNANFVKPTGDGLLMTFPYDENNLLEVSETVLTSCFKCLQEFPTFSQSDPMINFAVPHQLGIGVARGTACCLYAGKRILDYSGHLLNLCSRLMELARPSGIVIDSSYKKEIIPDSLKELFSEQDVYLRSIAEDKAATVLYLKDYVNIPDFYLKPLLLDKWVSQIQETTVRDLLKVTSLECAFRLKKTPKSGEKIRVVFSFFKKGQRGRVETDLPFIYHDDFPKPEVSINTDQIQKYVKDQQLAQNLKVKFKIDYVPKS